MSNPAVTQWLQEIAAAKAKAEARAKLANGGDSVNHQKSPSKAQDSNSQEKGQKSTTDSDHPSSTHNAVNPKPQVNYGIITSYNLKTRKKQLKLILPPEPIKPGPGECCGNDCDPCVNTIYWQDLAAHKDQVRSLEEEYKTACLKLETGLDEADSLTNVKNIQNEAANEEDGNGDGDESGLSIRSYRPFKIIKKRYLSETTLLVICDLPYPKHRSTTVATSPSKQEDYLETSMFHILIRFKRGDHFLTKAFTPVDFSKLSVNKKVRSEAIVEAVEHESEGSMNEKMAFLVKLYPSPHVTSDMFRSLMEYQDVDEKLEGNQNTDGDEPGFLYLRGPIQTSRDRLKNRELSSHANAMAISRPQARNERIVMIAAGSGITPMYQVLRRLHLQQQEDQEEGSIKELDLVYCNRMSSEIWLHQELKEICLHNNISRSDDPLVADGSILPRAGANRAKTIKVRVQHILSNDTSHKSNGTQDHHERFHIGDRISPQLLKDILQHRFNEEGSSTSESSSYSEHLRVLICGPPSFNADVSEMLAQLGYTDSERCEIHILE
ncbi:hypothetical protein BGZ46_010085 [Entomortierella lignicola]|nr:hypothetical protein BGZ46_010085 [Entomortierella lignicola]